MIVLNVLFLLPKLSKLSTAEKGLNFAQTKELNPQWGVEAKAKWYKGKGSRKRIGMGSKGERARKTRDLVEFGGNDFYMLLLHNVTKTFW